MKVVNDILYLDFQELVDLGISESTLNKAKLRKSPSWNFINDPDDKRKVLIQFETLKPNYKELVIAKYGNPYEYMASTAIKQYLNIDTKSRAFFENYVLSDGKGLPELTIKAYVQASEWLNMIDTIINNKSILKKLGLSKAMFWNLVCKLIETEQIQLPSAYTRLLNKSNEYKKDGYKVLVSKKFSNNNSQKLCGAAQDWLIAMYSLPIKMNTKVLWLQYNAEAVKHGWSSLKSETTVYEFLNRSDIKPQWYGARHGEKKHFRNKFTYSMKTQLPTVRDALWYGDGTKLNYFDSEGKLKASYTVYEVADTFSECLLGYYIGKSEDFVAQYEAYKMALQFSGQKPYEIRYDGQGGHKKLNTNSFLDKMANVGFKCKAYNGKSKTIESIFGRFQSQYMSLDWFFTGQNITAKKLDSRHNEEFIISNVKNLPSPEAIFERYAERRNEWNNAPHPKYGKSRIELYRESINEMAQPIDTLDMVNLFWMTNPKPITYYTHGISMTLAGHKYEYEVLENGMPCVDFRRKYIDKSFIVKYDPTDMEHIRLYLDSKKGLQFIAVASPRLEVPRAIQDYKEGSRALIDSLLRFANDEEKWYRDQAKARGERTGINPDALVAETLGFQMKSESYASPYDADDTDNDEFNIANYI